MNATTTETQIRNDIQAAIGRGATRIAMYSLGTGNMLLSWKADEDGEFFDEDVDRMVAGAAEDTEDYRLRAIVDGREVAI